ncbi:MAG: hypothetical protein RR856_11930, partial [Acinetobacter sp.]
REVATRWDGSATPEKNQKEACNQGGKFLNFDCVLSGATPPLCQFFLFSKNCLVEQLLNPSKQF